MDSGTKALMIAHMERSRTRSKRTITEQTDMLDDALAALEEGHLDVVKEFMERVMDALGKEAASLTVDGAITRDQEW